MSTNEEFDDLIRSKFGEQDFPFDEFNWDKAEELIDAKRKKEKRRRFFIIWFFGVLTGVGIILPVLYFSSSNEKSGQKKVSAQIKYKSNRTKENLFNKPSNISQEKDHQKTEKISPDKTELSAGEISVAQPNLSSNNSVPGNPSFRSDNTKTNDVSGKIINEGTQRSKVENNNIKIVDIKEDYQKSSPESAGNLATLEAIETVENRNKLNVNDSIENSQNNQTTKDTSINSIEVINAGNSTARMEQDSSVINKEGVQPKDSLDVTSAKTENVSEQQKPKEINDQTITSRWHAGIGGIYHFGWDLNGQRSGNGAAFSAGLSYEKFLNKKLSLQTGLFAQSSGNLNSYSKQVVFSHPDFGKNDSVVQLNYLQSYNLTIPLQFNFYLSSSSRIGVGITGSMVTNTMGKLKTTLIDNAGTTEIDNKRVSNYFQGICRFDTGLTISYEQQISKRLSGQLIFNYGLIDRIDNSYFGTSTIKEKDMYLRVSLNYKLFEK